MHVNGMRIVDGRNVKVLTRVYVDARGLNNDLRRNGFSPTDVEEHFSAFTSRPLFDYVDAGAGKDRTKLKIAGMVQQRSLQVCCS